MLLGYDHGLGMSFDAGQTWLRPDNLPTAQYYAVGFDYEVPYNVLRRRAGQRLPQGAEHAARRRQHSVRGLDERRLRRRLLQRSRLEGQPVALQREPVRRHLAARSEDRPDASISAPGARSCRTRAYRWNWSAPILVSPHNSDVIYHGAQVLLRSPFRGDTWEVISPDLTVNDPAKRGGGGNITWATITTIDESPIVPGLLWVGTDDGNVQVTKDGGQTWTNVRDKIPGHPGYWVSRVAASNASPGTAYVTITGLRNDDFRPFIWKTTDFGQTWTSIAGNLPQEVDQRRARETRATRTCCSSAPTSAST